MSELALPLLGLLTLGVAVAAAPQLSTLRRGRRADPSGAAAWVTLTLALVLAVASAEVVAVTNLGPQSAFGALAAAAGTLTAVGAIRRLPRRELALLGLLLGGVLVGWLLLYQLATPSAGLNPLPLLSRELLRSNPTQLQAFWLVELCWVMGAWIGWFAVAQRSGLMATGLPLVALLSVLINSPSAVQRLPVVPILLVAISAVALIGWTHQERQLPLWRAMDGEAPALGRHLRIVAGLAVSLGVLGLALPPMNRSNISATLFGGIQATGPPLNYAESTSGYATAVVPGGAIKEVPTEVLTYHTDAPLGKTYLQGEVFTDFSAGNWFSRYDATLLEAEGTALPYTGQESRLLDQRKVTLTVSYQDQSSSSAPDLLYAGTPLRTPSAGVGYQVSGENQGTRLLDVDQVAPESGATSVLAEGKTITTYATVTTAGPAKLERAGTKYPKWALPYATLGNAGDPAELATIIADAKQMAGGATNPYAQARNIQDALRHDEVYTLTPPPAPTGTWPLIYFLNYSHRGYCQYFAAAMGAMLRGLGIPTRLAGGFDAGHATSGSTDLSVTRADAHVWVQAYFPRYGWVNFEPTPAAFQRPPKVVTSATTATGSNPTGTNPRASAVHPGLRQLPTSGRAPLAPTAQPSGPPYLLYLEGVLGGVVLALLAWLWWWSRRVRSPAQLRARLGLLVALTHRGRPASMTLHELARACGELQLELEPALLGLAEAAERISFGPPGLTERARLPGWSPVGRRYSQLLLRAWRAGRRLRGESGLGPGDRLILGRD
ncbi:MAG TPA: transglutaminase-like domain-containing protein [Candidatus Dormibacteraeota bacterium]|nr:transglutaminase-like domain-containing protein [Candidatus Dormibacteraeota bacterium]